MSLSRRKNIRLKEYDYSQNGYYFVTICTKDRKHLLSKIINENMYSKTIKQTRYKRRGGVLRPHTKTIKQIRYKRRGGRLCPPEKIKLTKIGKIVDECWNNIKFMDNNINVNQYIIMPNHIHGIIEICGRAETPAPT